MERTGDRSASLGEHERLAELLAKEAIREALYRELDGWRRRDWPSVAAIWLPNAAAELGFDTEPRAESQLACLADAMRDFASSSLVVSNCTIELAASGRQAELSALVLAAHEPPPSRGDRAPLDALRFSDRWQREDDGAWRIAARKSESIWRAWLDVRRDDRVGDHRHALDWER